IAHYTTRDRNMLAIQSELISAHALGIRNILCLRGDAPRIGDYPNATAVWDVTSVGLITILANLNRGLDANGSPIGECADFCIGAAFNPHAENMRRERTLLQRKLEAGAHFVVTNPLFELTAMERCLEALADIKLPVLVGVMPLISARQANYLHHEVPGMTIPERIRRQIESAGEDADKIGLELALELLAAGRGIVRGAYIVPGGERYDIAIKLIGAARGLLSPTLHS
ncbi:MAG: methylenetetrahydrofolate reductase, partial [Candidatus Dormibacteraceae bacterium]